MVYRASYNNNVWKIVRIALGHYSYIIDDFFVLIIKNFNNLRILKIGPIDLEFCPDTHIHIPTFL